MSADRHLAHAVATEATHKLAEGRPNPAEPSLGT